MSTEQRLIDALVVVAKAHGIDECRLTNATARLDALNRIENQRDELKAEVEKRRAEHREAEPKLRELYQAANAYLVQVCMCRQLRRPALTLLEAEKSLRKALHDAFDYTDQIPF